MFRTEIFQLFQQMVVLHVPCTQLHPAKKPKQKPVGSVCAQGPCGHERTRRIRCPYLGVGSEGHRGRGQVCPMLVPGSPSGWETTCKNERNAAQVLCLHLDP